MKIFDLASFKSPKFSVFDHSHSNVLSYGIGEVIPVGYVDMSPNDRIKVNINEFTRFAAMLAPSFDNYEISIDGHFIPYRLIPDFTNSASSSLFLSDQDSEKFFNFTENADNTKEIETSWPHVLFPRVLETNGRVEGSLYDYLNYPTFPRLREVIREMLNAGIFLSEDWDSGFMPDNAPRYISYFWLPFLTPALLEGGFEWSNDWPNVPTLAEGYYYDFESGAWRSGTISGTHEGRHGFTYYSAGVGMKSFASGNIRPYWYWILYNKLGITSLAINSLPFGLNGYLDWDELFVRNNFRADSLAEEYIDWCVSRIFGAGGWMVYDDTGVLKNLYQAVCAAPVNLVPVKCYWRAISDWYANTNLDGDSETIYEEHAGMENDTSSIDWKPWKRRWAADYFTSAFDSPQVGQAQRIPVNGTIPDLRANNRLQQIFERAKYAGRRYIEQALAFFGARSSNARYDRTEVLFRETFTISPEAVTQMNTEELSSVNSPLGSFAGNAVAVSHHTGCDYTCEEHGMIMFMLSVRPKATYMQGTPKFLTKTKMTDFLIPQFSNLGEQEIKACEIYSDFVGTPADDARYEDEVFGYQRRYAEYMFMPNEVHSSMKTSLDFWHSARLFESLPNLKDVIEVDAERDGLNRVFSIQSRENIYTKLWFDMQVVRALPRMIDYSL